MAEALSAAMAQRAAIRIAIGLPPDRGRGVTVAEEADQPEVAPLQAGPVSLTAAPPIIAQPSARDATIGSPAAAVRRIGLETPHEAVLVATIVAGIVLILDGTADVLRSAAAAAGLMTAVAAA
ncbi:MAG: hypothetical protein ACK5MR_12910 [Cumulibacter sp.]